MSYRKSDSESEVDIIDDKEEDEEEDEEEEDQEDDSFPRSRSGGRKGRMTRASTGSLPSLLRKTKSMVETSSSSRRASFDSKDRKRPLRVGTRVDYSSFDSGKDEDRNDSEGDDYMEEDEEEDDEENGEEGDGDGDDFEEEEDDDDDYGERKTKRLRRTKTDLDYSENDWKKKKGDSSALHRRKQIELWKEQRKQEELATDLKRAESNRPPRRGAAKSAIERSLTHAKIRIPSIKKGDAIKVPTYREMALLSMKELEEGSGVTIAKLVNWAIKNWDQALGDKEPNKVRNQFKRKIEEATAEGSVKKVSNIHYTLTSSGKAELEKGKIGGVGGGGGRGTSEEMRTLAEHRGILSKLNEENKEKRMRFLATKYAAIRPFINNPKVEQAIQGYIPASSNGTSTTSSSSSTSTNGGDESHGSENGNGKANGEEVSAYEQDAKDKDNVPQVYNTTPPYIKNGSMKAYQLKGLNWLISLHEKGMGGILADEMGLGKTLQSISFLGHLTVTLGVQLPHLVVAPLSVLSSWIAELKRWCPSLRIIKFHSANKEGRDRLRKEVMIPGKFDVVVTTYEMVKNTKHALSRFNWYSLIIDEAHRIKSDQTQIAEAIRRIHCAYPILLTGTPLQNNLHELWSLLNFLFPEVFDDSTVFDSSFDLAKRRINPEMLKKAQLLLQPFMLRRLKTEVEYSLPSKTEIRLYVPLTPMQTFFYKSFLTRDFTKALKATGNDAFLKLLFLVMQLRKTCNHPFLFPGSEPEPIVTDENIVEASGKMLLLDKLLPRLQSEGHRVLIFSQFTSMLDILQDYCSYRGFTAVRLDGSTNRVQRKLDIDNFNSKNSDLFIFLISTRAGGLGINLATADTIILYDTDWNPQVDLQAQDRVHRIGQTKPVTVYRLITEDTVEERVLQIAQKKLYLDKMVLGHSSSAHGIISDPTDEVGDDGQGTSLSKKELMSMVMHGAKAIMGDQKKASIATSSSSSSEDPSLEEAKELKLEIDVDAILANSKKRDLIVANPGLATSSSNGEGAEDDQTSVELFSSYIFQGVDHRQVKSVTEEWAESLPAKRIRESTITIYNGERVLKKNMYSMEDGACLPSTHALKESSLEANQKKKKREDFTHQTFCQSCKVILKGSKQVAECQVCPRAYHIKCVDFNKPHHSFWRCPQHRCTVCNQNAAAAGGMLFRCVNCDNTFCEEHLPYGVEVLGKDSFLESLGYARQTTSCFIRCLDCGEPPAASP